jgi:hypothetical protein
MRMFNRLVGIGVGGFFVVGCAVDVGESGGGDPRDVKPEDGSELAGANLGSTAEPHALHYTDATNLWLEPGYPMGQDNPNCKDWWIYDRYLSSRPAIGTTKFTTYESRHPWARGDQINQMMAAIPDALGYSAPWKSLLVDYNSVVARANGRCSGRYVFQWDNRTSYGPFEKTGYWASANIPSYLIPANKAACTTTAGESVPAVMVDLYACEAPNSGAVGALSTWCARDSGHWRKVGSASATGWWSEYTKKCSVGTGVYYPAPTDRVAVSFNMVIKAGVGHGVAPAEIYIVRYN